MAERNQAGAPTPIAPHWHPLWGVFRVVTAHPKKVLCIWAALLAGCAALIPLLQKDSSPDAYIPPQHPAVLFRQQTDQMFGLYDPVVVLIDTKKPGGIFNPQTLNLVKWYTEQFASVEHIDAGRISSLFTVNGIQGTEDGLEVAPFLTGIPQTEAELAALRDTVMDFPLHLGTLVARDGSATVIAAPITDPKAGGRVYHALMALGERAPIHGEDVHVAGEAVLGEYLGEYLDKDAARINPMVVIIIAGVLFASYRTWRGVFLPGLSAVFGVAVALGIMAALRVPFTILTNVLPANVLALGVAYGIHILREYYEQTATPPGPRLRETVVNVMMTMRRPILYATLTDMVGFLVLSFTTHLPPMRMMGYFAALGIAATLTSTLFAIPAALVLLRVRPSPAFHRELLEGQHWDRWAHMMSVLGRAVLRHPKAVIAVCALVSAYGVYGAGHLEVNDDRAGHFHASEPIYQANDAINRLMDGTIGVDIVVDTGAPEGLFRPENLRRIEALQEHLKTIPHVSGSVSIVDYLKQLNRAMNGGNPEAFVLPDSEELAAQYVLTYSFSGDAPLSQVADSEYWIANIHALCNTGLFTEIDAIKMEIDRYLAAEFATPDLTARVSGRLNVYYAWMQRLELSHFLGALFALLTVWVMTSVGFRTAVAGFYCVIPVLATLLAVYAVMGLTGIWLGIGTSAFASIAVGITVNFAIHELDRILHLTRGQGKSLEDALRAMYASTGRAVLFNFLCVFLGITTLTLSQLPPLQWFGILLATALLVGFVTSIVLLPALLLVFRPRFLLPVTARKGTTG
ncbi:MAG: MMPL family transporter [Candidatus Hydrogenedentes bacterium]|nr:MMPL family transporter [Candidatus Hydrogenedentota bacterium]